MASSTTDTLHSPESLEKLANSKFEFAAHKLALLEKVDAQLIFALQGGLFKATPEFIAYLYALVEVTKSNNSERPNLSSAVILDQYDNPIKVDLEIIIVQAIRAQQYALNAYLEDYTCAKKIRHGRNI